MKIKIILNGTEELVAALEQKSKSDFVAVCNRTVGYTLHYAPHVEYGHRQQPERFVPQIGKRLKASYVPGQRFLQRSVEAVRPQFEQMLKDELKED